MEGGCDQVEGQQYTFDTIQVMDTCHAREHVGDVGHAGLDDIDLGKARSQEWQDELDQSGRVDWLIKELRSHGKSTLTDAKYFTNSRKQVCYSKFMAQDICVSSGVLEDACRSSVGSRLKLNDMH